MCLIKSKPTISELYFITIEVLSIKLIAFAFPFINESYTTFWVIGTLKSKFFKENLLLESA
jgi:hypothetical protein